MSAAGSIALLLCAAGVACGAGVIADFAASTDAACCAACSCALTLAACSCAKASAAAFLQLLFELPN